MARLLRREQGQSTVEWVGLVFVVAALVATLILFLRLAVSGIELAGAIGSRILCAIGLDGSCEDEESRLVAAYGGEVAGLVAANAPLVRYEKGMRALPVDYRRCREDACAEGAEEGEVDRSLAGEPTVAFLHAIDCRADAARPPGEPEPDCSGSRAGSLYLQYWFYYPGSATGEGSIAPDLVRQISGGATHHPDDWESLQLRIGPDGAKSARASSHEWYSYELGGRRGWGPSLGSLYVSGGSHAGNVLALRDVERSTPAAALRLIPLEPIAAREPRTRFAVTPPWRKRVWLDPEYEGTD